MHLKTYKPSPDYLYFHPGVRDDCDRWSCCRQTNSYIAQRGCKKVASMWKTRKTALFYYLHKNQDKLSSLRKLPSELVKDIVFYL